MQVFLTYLFLSIFLFLPTLFVKAETEEVKNDKPPKSETRGVEIVQEPIWIDLIAPLLPLNTRSNPWVIYNQKDKRWELANLEESFLKSINNVNFSFIAELKEAPKEDQMANALRSLQPLFGIFSQAELKTILQNSIYPIDLEKFKDDLEEGYLQKIKSMGYLAPFVSIILENNRQLSRLGSFKHYGIHLADNPSGNISMETLMDDPNGTNMTYISVPLRLLPMDNKEFRSKLEIAIRQFIIDEDQKRASIAAMDINSYFKPNVCDLIPRVMDGSVEQDIARLQAEMKSKCARYNQVLDSQDSSQIERDQLEEFYRNTIGGYGQSFEDLTLEISDLVDGLEDAKDNIKRQSNNGVYQEIESNILKGIKNTLDQNRNASGINDLLTYHLYSGWSNAVLKYLNNSEVVNQVSKLAMLLDIYNEYVGQALSNWYKENDKIIRANEELDRLQEECNKAQSKLFQKIADVNYMRSILRGSEEKVLSEEGVPLNRYQTH